MTQFHLCCAALRTENFLLVADSNLRSVFHVEYATGDTTQLLEYDADASPFAVAYDPTTDLVYWSDRGLNRHIGRYSLLFGNSSSVFVSGAKCHSYQDETTLFCNEHQMSTYV